MLGRALDAGVPAAWVTADEAYGKDYKFRSWLEQRRIGYVVAVACNQVVPGSTGTSRADVLARSPGAGWKRRSCGQGAKGPRLFVWAVASLPCYEDTTPPGWSRWLLVRRSLTRNSQGRARAAYYLCCAPAGTTDDELIRVAGARWAVEECFQTAKNETGSTLPGPRLQSLVPAIPGHPRARLPGRHGGDRPKSPGSGLIPITLGEVRRLLAHLITTVPSRGRRLGLVRAGAAATSTAPKPATTSGKGRIHEQYEVLLEYSSAAALRYVARR